MLITIFTLLQVLAGMSAAEIHCGERHSSDSTRNIRVRRLLSEIVVVSSLPVAKLVSLFQKRSCVAP